MQAYALRTMRRCAREHVRVECEAGVLVGRVIRATGEMKNDFWQKDFARQIAGDILPLYLRSRASQGVDARWPMDPLMIEALTTSSRKYTRKFKLARFFDFAASRSNGRRC